MKYQLFARQPQGNQKPFSVAYDPLQRAASGNAVFKRLLRQQRLP